MTTIEIEPGEDRRVIHAWFRTPRGHNRSGLGDAPGGSSGHASGRPWRRAGGPCVISKPSGSPGCPTTSAAEVRDFDLKKYALPKYSKELRKSRKYMARDIQLAVAAAQLAVADAGLVDGGVDPTRIGIDLGAGLISSELDELAPAIAPCLRSGPRLSTSRSGAASRSG